MRSLRASLKGVKFCQLWSNAVCCCWLVVRFLPARQFTYRICISLSCCVIVLGRAWEYDCMGRNG
jgi:hypothetical protein